MKKIILGLIVISIFSCTPDKNKDENKDEKGLKLVQIIGVDSKKDKLTYKWTYSYSENGLLKSEVTEDLINPEKTSRDDYTYNSNGKLYSITYYDGGKKSTQTFEYDGDLIVKKLREDKTYVAYSYNPKNQLVKAIDYNNDGSFSEYNYDYDSNGNIVKYTSRFNGGGGEITKDDSLYYSYDTKKNPSLLYYPNAYTSIIAGTGLTAEAGKNNLISGKGWDYPYEYTYYEYTYNDRDYPIERIYKDKKGVVEGKIKYIYNK